MVLCAEDLIDHLLPFLDVFMLGTVMQINRQWKRVAMRDAHWEDRIGGFLCNRTFQADAREVMRPTQLWSWYSRMERYATPQDAIRPFGPASGGGRARRAWILPGP